MYLASQIVQIPFCGEIDCEDSIKKTTAKYVQHNTVNITLSDMWRVKALHTFCKGAKDNQVTHIIIFTDEYIDMQ